MKKLLKYFTAFELFLWLFSVTAVTVSFLMFDRVNFINTLSSVIGVSAILLCAKGNPAGQVLMIIFSVLYGITSFAFSYYGEMITYLGMTLPMAALSLVSWLTHPYKGKKSQVEVRKITKKEILIMFFASAAVTALFYFVLKALGTANLVPGTVSVTTSFVAAYLTYLRSPWFSFAYALNDIVLIVLWSLAATVDASCVSVIICFAMFLANDLYCFFSWQIMYRKQSENQPVI